VPKKGGVGTATNRSAGSRRRQQREEIFFNVAFKPVATIMKPRRRSIWREADRARGQGPPRPLRAPQAVPIVEAMAASSLSTTGCETPPRTRSSPSDDAGRQAVGLPRSRGGGLRTREVLADLIEDGLGEGTGAVLVSSTEWPDPADAKLGAFGRWTLLPEAQVEADMPADATHVFIVLDGRLNPVDQIEAFKSWLGDRLAEVARVVCVVNCQLLEKNRSSSHVRGLHPLLGRRPP